MNLLIRQKRHAKRQVEGSWATAQVHFRLSKSASGLGRGHIFEEGAFFRAGIRTEYKFFRCMIDEMSLDITLVA